MRNLMFLLFVFTSCNLWATPYVESEFEKRQKVKSIDEFINSFINSPYQRTKGVFDDPSGWKEDKVCKTALPNGELILKNYLFNRSFDYNGALGFLFLKKGEDITFLKASSTLYKQKMGCFEPLPETDGVFYYSGWSSDTAEAYEYYFDIKNNSLYKYVRDKKGRNYARPKIVTLDNGERVIAGNQLCSEADMLLGTYKAGSVENNYLDGGSEFRKYMDLYCNNISGKLNGKFVGYVPFTAYDFETGQLNFPYIKRQLFYNCGRHLFTLRGSYEANIDFMLEFLEKHQQYDNELKTYITTKCLNK